MISATADRPVGQSSENLEEDVENLPGEAASGVFKSISWLVQQITDDMDLESTQENASASAVNDFIDLLDYLMESAWNEGMLPFDSSVKSPRGEYTYRAMHV